MLRSMTENTALRPAEVSDLPFILRQEREYMETIEPHALLGWLTVLDQNLEVWIDCLPQTVVCVDAEGNRLGYAMRGFAGDSETLIAISVLASHRRQGIGRLLLDAFEQAERATGARVAEFGVYQSNRQAYQLYLASGYEATGEEDGRYLLLRKTLSPSDEHNLASAG